MQQPCSNPSKSLDSSLSLHDALALSEPRVVVSNVLMRARKMAAARPILGVVRA